MRERSGQLGTVSDLGSEGEQDGRAHLTSQDLGSFATLAMRKDSAPSAHGEHGEPPARSSTSGSSASEATSSPVAMAREVGEQLFAKVREEREAIGGGRGAPGIG